MMESLRNLSPSAIAAHKNIFLQQSTLSLEERYMSWLTRRMLESNSFFVYLEKPLRACFSYLFVETIKFMTKHVSEKKFQAESFTPILCLKNLFNYLEIFLNEFRKLKIATGGYILVT